MRDWIALTEKVTASPSRTKIERSAEGLTLIERKRVGRNPFAIINLNCRLGYGAL
jgi:hypothetical protein